MGHHYRKIMCPEARDDVTYLASNLHTGNILQSRSIEELLKRIAADPEGPWRFESKQT